MSSPGDSRMRADAGRAVPAGMEPERLSRVPVVVLSGFLGAGKTTLLRHLLTQTEGQKWALVVNDLAALNLDAALLANVPGGLSGPAPTVTAPLVELSNGCVCCTRQDDLAETLLRLAAEGAYDHILVETTGVAEPRGIARLFTTRNPFGRSVGDALELTALVTVVDGAAWSTAWGEAQAGARETPPTGERPIFELLIEQVEVADLIVLNKCDLLSPEEVERVEAALAGLNPHAEVYRAEQAQVPREIVLDRTRFSPATTPSGASWVAALNELTRPSPAGRGAPVARAVRGGAGDAGYARFGLRTVVWQARRPMARDRFLSLMRQGLPGVLRAKGFYWLAEQPDEMGFVSIAGGVVRHEWLTYWWAAQIEAGRVRLEDRPALVRSLWQEPHGDRRQELVFIGVGLDEARLRAELDACLVKAEKSED